MEQVDGTGGGSSAPTPADLPPVRVLRVSGGATDEELAAVVGALLALGVLRRVRGVPLPMESAEGMTHAQQGGGATGSRWAHRGDSLGAPAAPGRGSWRTALRVR